MKTNKKRENYKKNTAFLLAIFVFLTIFILLSKTLFSLFFPLDNIVNNYFNDLRNISFLVILIKTISHLGDWKILLTLSVVLTFIISRKSKFDSGVFIIAFLFTGGLVYTLKEFFQRARPEGLIEATTFSFPSGHTALSIVFYGFIAYFSYRYVKTPLRKIIIFLSITLILFIGFSRIFLGIHWLSDVLASVVISGSILLIGIWIIENQKLITSKLFEVFVGFKNKRPL
ncbi:MAG: phosphatase PAP2 family protein [Minisyncoccales bacterium]